MPRARPDAARIRAIYDDLAPAYDRTVGLSERIMLGRFRRDYGALMRGDVLEIAAGSGLNFPHYPDDGRVASVTAVDLSPNMLAIARTRADELSRSRKHSRPWQTLTTRTADAERLPFPDAAFDVVGISLALCTVPDPERALREAVRVCRPGGTIVLMEHVISPVRPVAGLMRRLAPGQLRRMGCDITRRTDRLARDVGLAVDSDRTRLFGVFHLIVAHPPER